MLTLSGQGVSVLYRLCYSLAWLRTSGLHSQDGSSVAHSMVTLGKIMCTIQSTERMLTLQSVVQTMVGELVKRPEHEPRAYAVMPFVWSIGTIIGPSIGGYFAEPAQNFPSLFNPTGLFAKFPYLLPNLICSSLLVVSIVMAYFLLEETHPDKQPRGLFEQYDAAVAETPLLPAQGATADAAANLTSESYGTFNAVEVQRDELWRVKSNGEWVETPASEKVFTWTVVQFVIALGIFTYHSVSHEAGCVNETRASTDMRR
jgi:MFS family permease